MTIKNCVFACVVILGGSFSASANTVSEYQSLVNKWLSLSQQNRVLLADWQSHKSVLTQRLQLVKEEKSLLQEKLSKSKNQQDQVSKRRSEILAEQSQLEQDQALMSQWLTQTLNTMTNQLAQLPPPLQKIWQEELTLIRDDASNSEKLEVVLMLYSKHSEFNQRISFQKSTIHLANQETRLVEQLYIGSKVAYISAPDGSFTGIGFVANNQWQWQLNNAISAEQFRSAKAMLAHTQAAEFMSLPVKLELN